MRVDADARAAGKHDRRERAGRRREIVLGIFGVDAHFDRVPVRLQVVLREAERLAGGDANLLLDQVDAVDHLGDRMLDLDARVHLHEVDVVAVRPGTRASRRSCSRPRAPPSSRSRAAASRIAGSSSGAGASSISF